MLGQKQYLPESALTGFWSVVVVTGLIAVPILTQINYFLHGASTFHVNSVGSFTITNIFLFFQNISDFDILPKLWTNRVGAGVGINPAFSYFNPYFLLAGFFDEFSNALIFYDIQMKLLGGIGMYLLLRNLKLLPATAWLGATLFSFNGVIAAWSQDPQFSYGLCFLPWLFLVFKRMLIKPDLRASLLMALVLSSIFFVSIIHIYTFIILYVGVPFIAFRVQRHRISWRQLIAYGALGLILHLLLISFELVPIYFNLQMSDRAGMGGQGIYYIRTSLILTATGLAFRHLLMNSRRAIGIGIKIAGLFCLFFGLAQIFYVQFQDIGTVFLKMYMIGSHPLTMDDFGFDLQPIRYLYTGLQSFFVCAAFIIVVNRQEPRSEELAHVMLIVSFLGLLTIVKADHLDVNVDVPKIYRAYFVPLIGILILISIALDRLIRWVMERPKWHPVWKQSVVGLLLVILAGEAFYIYDYRTLFSDGLKYTQNTTPETKFLAKLGPTERIIDVYENEHKEWQGNFPTDRLSLIRYTFPVYFGSHPFTLVGVPLRSRELFDFHAQAVPRYFGVDQQSPVNEFLNMAGVGYIASRLPLASTELDLVQSGRDYRIYRNKDAWPRVALFGKVDYLPEKEILAAIDSVERKDRYASAYLDITDAGDVTLSGNADNKILSTTSNSFMSSRGTVRIVSYQDEYLVIDCEIQQASLLMLSDTFFPGWKAYIGDQEQRIYKTNHAFRGVRVNPGSYRLVMKFEPYYKFPTLMVSMVTFLIVIGLLVRSAFIGRQRDTESMVL